MLILKIRSSRATLNQPINAVSEIIAVCSQIRTEHISILCGQNVQFVCTFASLVKSTVGLMSALGTGRIVMILDTDNFM